MIFDYQNEYDFKFVGIDDKINKLVMGHRDAAAGISTSRACPGRRQTRQVVQHAGRDQRSERHAGGRQQGSLPAYLCTRVSTVVRYALNWGMVGMGSNNAQGSFDNIRVQILPPQITLEKPRTSMTAGATVHRRECGQLDRRREQL